MARLIYFLCFVFAIFVPYDFALASCFAGKSQLQLQKNASLQDSPQNKVSQKNNFTSLNKVEQLIAYGSVLDEDGEPLESATVLLVAPKPWRWGMANPLVKQAYLKMKTDRDGKFRITIDPSNKGFLIQGKADLVAFKDGHQLDIRSFPLNRLLVDLPFELVLKELPKLNLSVTSWDGRPVADAEVSPSFSGDDFLSLSAVSENITASTDSNGLVQLKNLAPFQSDFFYVRSKTHGNQLLRVQASERNGEIHWNLRLQKTKSISGQFILPQGADLSEIEGKKIPIISFHSTNELQYQQSYEYVVIDKAGRFTCKNSLGSTHRIAQPLIGKFMGRTAESFVLEKRQTETWEIPLAIAKEYRVKILDDSGNPFPNASCEFQFPVINPRSDKNGIVRFHLPKGKLPYGQLFVMDSTQKLVHPGQFGVFLEKVFQTGNELPEIHLAKSMTIRGKVIDRNGKAVAGAKIHCQRKSGHHYLKSTETADRHGYFDIKGVVDNSGVELEAESIGQKTAIPVRIENNSAKKSDEIVLTLIPNKTAIPFGRLVDQFGQPAPFVKVLAYRTYDLQKEAFSGGIKRPTPYSADRPFVMTDRDGRFQLPPTTDLKSPILIAVKDGRYFPFGSGSVEIAHQIQNGEILLGDSKLEKYPNTTEIPIRILGAKKSEVEDAEILVLNYSQPTKVFHYTKKPNRKINKILIPDSEFLLAVKSPGYVSKFIWINPDSQKSLDISLTSITDPKAAKSLQSLVNRQIDKKKIRRAMANLLSSLKTPEPNKSNFNRLFQYIQLAAYADPEKGVRFVGGGYKKFQQGLFAAQFLVDQLEGESPAVCNRFYLEQNLHRGFYFSALAVEDPIIRQERFAEAIVLIRNLAGRQRLNRQMELAFALQLDGQSKAAKVLATEAWNLDAGKEWKDLIKEKKRKESIGFSRNVLPTVYLIDPEVAVKLGPLTSQGFVDSKNTHPASGMAALFLSDRKRFESFLKKYPYKFRLDSLILDHLEPFSADRSTKYHDLLKVLADNISDPNGKFRCNLLVAESTDDLKVQDEYFRRAADVIENESGLLDFSSINFGGLFLPTKRCQRLTKKHYNDLLFEALKHGRSGFQSTRSQQRFALLAAYTGIGYPQLAKKLLRPALLDQSRFFSEPDYADLQYFPHLAAAMAIDVDWGTSVTQDLSAKFGSNDTSAIYKLIDQTNRTVNQLMK